MKRKGFTLVELLIVIVVIGILSAMMMLSSTEAVTSARANNIVSNLRNLKTAALALYVDKLDTWEGGTTAPTFKEVLTYMNSSSGSGTTASIPEGFEGYDIVVEGNDSTVAAKSWYVVYGTISSHTAGAKSVAIESRVSTKLASRAKSVGLYGTPAKVTTNSDGSLKMPGQYADKGAVVSMFVR